ncbi:Potassium transport system protein kup [Heracleum sosnowskyi]|uniref:Potassium transport system protein kup n=1 Tax=Heracleum sosnowskyi TaxID=360622 RepID=A0AAD8ITZ5_9APIA|nr:Potassium transport system protein kup [Heracleum sosnowskyi]
MGLLVSRLEMLLLLVLCFFFSLPSLRAQTSGKEALDVLIQDYAFRAFVRPRTGVPFDGIPPSNLSGVQISAMRLRSGSLRTRGVVKGFKEFTLYPGIIEQPYVERLVLVYQNLGNWSARYYPLPGYVYLAPVLGLLVYDATDLSAKHLQELNILVSGQPISVEFSDVKLAPVGSVPKCVSFDLHGGFNFSNVVSENRCSTVQQGHFSIVAKSTAPPPAPVSPRPSTIPPGPKHRDKEKKDDSKVWIIVGSVVGGFVLLSLLGVLILWLRRYRRKKRMQKMEKAAEVGEALHMASVGSTKAPAAMVTRTQPTLETEYMP